MFRTDDMYGDYPTLEEIKRDYNEIIELVGNVTTIEQAKRLNVKGKFTVEANGFFLDEYIKNGGTDKELEWLRYESYGCLSYIYCHINNGEIVNILFDVWSNAYDYDFIHDVRIEQLTEDYMNDVIGSLR